MARSTEGGGGCGERGEGAAGNGAVVGGDAGCEGGVTGVDGKGVGCTVRVCIVENHLWEVKSGCEGGGDRGADKTTEIVGGVRRLCGEAAEKGVSSVGGLPGMADHEGHLFSCDVLGSANEVAFVLAVGGVENDDKLAIFCT